VSTLALAVVRPWAGLFIVFSGVCPSLENLRSGLMRVWACGVRKPAKVRAEGCCTLASSGRFGVFWDVPRTLEFVLACSWVGLRWELGI